MLIDNINYLKRKYNDLYERLYTLEQEKDTFAFKVDTAKNGSPSLYQTKEKGDIRITSAYDPVEEASIILEQYQNIDQYEHILFLGVGLGYVINAFADQYPEKKVYIYEPSEEIMIHYLNEQRLPTKNIENICVSDDLVIMNQFISEQLRRTNKKLLIIETPVYKLVFRETYDDFIRNFRNLLKHKRTSLHTEYAFQKRWILNGMKNFPEVLSSTNILMNKQGQFKGKTAILVAAGPSLDDELDNLKQIIAEKSAYVFSAGWSIATLLKNNIKPHAFTSYDPTSLNQRVFKLISDESEQFPLVFGSTIGHECLEYFKGPKLHMVTSQDTTASYYLKADNEKKIEIVMDAPNIAVITLQLLGKLGFSKVLLVGQNFAYREDKVIASGYTGPIQSKGNIDIEDVYGNMTKTEEKFLGMRRQMEMHIKMLKEVEVINTTRGGAKIQGTSFKHLEDVMKDELTTAIVDDAWYERDDSGYDLLYLENKMQLMDSECKHFTQLTQEAKDTLQKIRSLARNKNLKQVDKMYPKLDDTFNQMKDNDYFAKFIMPMNRVFYGMFLTEIKDVKYETNSLKKAEIVINEFGKFIFECEKDISNTDRVLKDIDQAIIQKI